MPETTFQRDLRCENLLSRVRRCRNGREPKMTNARWRQSSENVLRDISERANNSCVDSRLVHSEEPTVQICFDFTKGRCARRNCKFSHDFDAIVKYNSKEQGICFDFLRGECNRGPLCRFSHDLTNVMKQWATELRGGGPARPPCGICYDFVRGKCPRGKKCRFSHDLREIAMATSRQSQPETTNSSRRSQASSTKDRSSAVLRSRSSVDSNDSYRSSTINNNSNNENLAMPNINKSIWKTPNSSAQLVQALPLAPKDAEKPKTRTVSRLPLCNIRSRQLLGRDLCQAIGMPDLNSSLAVHW